MSTQHSEDWHVGHAAGYLAAEDDIVELVSETIADWYAMKLVDDRQMLSLKDLSHFLELRQARR